MLYYGIVGKINITGVFLMHYVICFYYDTNNAVSTKMKKITEHCHFVNSLCYVISFVPSVPAQTNASVEIK